MGDPWSRGWNRAAADTASPREKAEVSRFAKFRDSATSHAFQHEALRWALHSVRCRSLSRVAFGLYIGMVA